MHSSAKKERERERERKAEGESRGEKREIIETAVGNTARRRSTKKQTTRKHRSVHEPEEQSH